MVDFANEEEKAIGNEIDQYWKDSGNDVTSMYKSFIYSLGSILEKVGMPVYPQERNLIDYTKNLCSIIPLNQESFLRKARQNIRRLLGRIPLRSEGGFLSYLFNNKTQGPVYRYYSYILEKLESHSNYKDVWDFKTLTENFNADYIELSYMSLSLDELCDFFNNQKSLKRLVFSNNVIDGALLVNLTEDRFQKLINSLKELEELEELVFDINKLGFLPSKRLTYFKSLISDLKNLKTLSLRDNQIDDHCFESLFNDFQFNENLKEIKLSNNFLRFNTEKTKNILEDISKNNLILKIPYNYINNYYFYSKGDRNKDGNIVEESDISLDTLTLDTFSNILKTDSQETKKIESLLNPKYFFDKHECIVTVEKKTGEHSGVMLERIDDKNQLHIIYYHLQATKCCGQINKNCQTDPNMGGVEIKENFTSGLLDFIEKRHLYSFGKFAICDVVHVERINAKLNQNRLIEFSKTSPDGEVHNCLKYAIERVYNPMLGNNNKISEQMTCRFWAVPTFNLHNTSPVFSRRLAFSNKP